MSKPFFDMLKLSQYTGEFSNGLMNEFFIVIIDYLKANGSLSTSEFDEDLKNDLSIALVEFFDLPSTPTNINYVRNVLDSAVGLLIQNATLQFLSPTNLANNLESDLINQSKVMIVNPTWDTFQLNILTSLIPLAITNMGTIPEDYYRPREDWYDNIVGPGVDILTS